MSHRLSLGGTALRDSSARYNNSTTSSRRSSFGGKALQKDATPQKDSRAMLEEWRRTTEDNANKREFGDANAGTTALERYRMRKQQKLETENLPPSGRTAMSSVPIHSAPLFDDDDMTGEHSRAALGTPAFSRRLAGGGRAARRKSFSVGPRHRSSPSLTQDSEGTFMCSRHPMMQACCLECQSFGFKR